MNGMRPLRPLCAITRFTTNVLPACANIRLTKFRGSWEDVTENDQ